MRALPLLALLAGCFNPSPKEGFACFGPDRWCPEPLSCQPDDTCRSSPGGGPDGGDAPGDDGTTGGPANLAFVTSGTFTALSFGSVAEADKKCEDIGASIGHGGRYVAWLSTTAAPAGMRLGNASGWRRVDGQPFAATRADLLAGKILYPLRKDENNQDLVADVMTGTVPDGTASENCLELQSGSSSELILLGASDADINRWTNTSEGHCNEAFHIYCLQADTNTVVTINPSPGPVAFLSSPFTPGGGLNAADTVCRTDATANGLTGNFKAALATTTTTAVGRVAPPGTPWVRVDGVETTASFFTFDAAINVTADGTHVDDAVFCGATLPDVVAASGTENCNNWGGGGSSALIGRSARAITSEAWATTTSGCAATRVYCISD